MIRGVYIAGSGMLAESTRQDVVANNLANATTTGFKRSVATGSPFGDMLLRSMGSAGAPAIGPLSMGAQVQGVATLQEQGPLRATGNRLDVALVGEGHLTVAAPEGRRYTRDGSLALDAAGRLTTGAGHPVLGVDGPLVLGPGEVTIAADGTVSQGGAPRGRLLLTRLDPVSVEPAGGGLVTGAPEGAATARVRQGHLEGSTVDVVTEMVELIRVMRSFEANQKAVQAQDEALQASVTRVGAAA